MSVVQSEREKLDIGSNKPMWHLFPPFSDVSYCGIRRKPTTARVPVDESVMECVVCCDLYSAGK